MNLATKLALGLVAGYGLFRVGSYVTVRMNQIDELARQDVENLEREIEQSLHRQQAIAAKNASSTQKMSGGASTAAFQDRNDGWAVDNVGDFHDSKSGRQISWFSAPISEWRAYRVRGGYRDSNDLGSGSTPVAAARDAGWLDFERHFPAHVGRWGKIRKR